MLPQIETLLDLADWQLAEIREMYVATLSAQEPGMMLQAKIKNLVENQRSALEYLAHAITERDGKAGSKAFWPDSPDPASFPIWFDKNMPGVRQARPDIADAFERHQSYQPGHAWIAHLVALTNENKHRELTPQTREEQRHILVQNAGGIAVEYLPFQPGQSGVVFGDNVEIGGVPVDPATQRPVPSQSQTVTETVYVDWKFRDLGVSALSTLTTIQGEILPVVHDVSLVAGL